MRSYALNGLSTEILFFGELVEGSAITCWGRDEICRLGSGRMVYRAGYVDVPIGILANASATSNNGLRRLGYL